MSPNAIDTATIRNQISGTRWALVFSAGGIQPRSTSSAKLANTIMARIVISQYSRLAALPKRVRIRGPRYMRSRTHAYKASPRQRPATVAAIQGCISLRGNGVERNAPLYSSPPCSFFLFSLRVARKIAMKQPKATITAKTETATSISYYSQTDCRSQV